MNHLDKTINIMSAKHEKKEQVKKTWEELLSETIAAFGEAPIALGNEDFELERISLFDNCLSIYIPKYFKEMSLEHINLKYINQLKPNPVYENIKGSINIGFLLIEEVVVEKSQLIEIRNIMKNSFVKLNPSSKIFDYGDFIANEENQIAYYTFDNAVLDGQMYNLVFITLLGEKTLVCNMNCLKKDKETIKLLFYGIMKTVKIENHNIKENATSTKETELEKSSEEEIKPQKELTPTAEQLQNRLFFEPEKLITLHKILDFEVEIPDGYTIEKGIYGTTYERPKYKNIDIIICENQNGETPLNNIYAIDKDKNFLWSVQNKEIDFENTNYTPFFRGGLRGENRIYAVDEDNSIYLINSFDGTIVYKETRPKI